MALSNISGFPRIGRNRDLKFATEGYWRGQTSADELGATAKAIRVENWKLMQDQGIDLIPSNDFSYYDQVLDTIALVGAVPERYGWDGGQVDLDTYFAMARGRQTDELDVTAMEMTKWFDTNYHYLVPELGPDTRFSLSGSKPFDEHAEAMEELGIDTVPVLIGPVSFLLLSKPADGVDERFDALDLIEPLVEVYGEVIERLAEQGATWVQLDEPCFVEDRTEKELDALRLAYEELGKVHERPRILVKTYFDHVGDAYGGAARAADRGSRPGLHRVRPRGPALARMSTCTAVATTPSSSPTTRSARSGSSPESSTAGTSGSITSSIRSTRSMAMQSRTGQLVVSTSCSLLHTPIDLDAEPADGDADLDDEMRSWMAFAVQKVGEVATLAKGVGEGRDAIADELDANDRARDSRRESARTSNIEVRARIEALGEEHDQRSSPLNSAGRPSALASTYRSSSPRRRSAPIRRRTRSARRA